MAIERNHTPIIAPTILGGASFVTMERPTGLKHSSPIVCKKYKPMSHHGLTSTPCSCAILAVGLGFALIIPAAKMAQEQGVLVSPWWLIGLYFLHTIGELCLSPVGLSIVTKRSE